MAIDKRYLYRRSCEQHCGSSSSSCISTGRTYQENQSWATGKHVPTSQRGTQWAPQKNHCKPSAKEKTLLLDLVKFFHNHITFHIAAINNATKQNLHWCDSPELSVRCKTKSWVQVEKKNQRQQQEYEYEY